MKKITSGCCLLVLFLFCCKKPYNPPVIASASSYLVVEGVINSGNDSTIIKLSKTVNLNAQVTLNPLPGATVTVESDQSASWGLTGDNKGNYVAPGLNLPVTSKYRLSIKTADGKQYLSDFIIVKPTPPIDSIGYTVKNKGIELYVNSHDPANNTHYYRWDYNETWLFHSKYESEFMVDPSTNNIVPRPSDKGVYYCYANEASSNILLNSTAKLSKDEVYQSPLATIPYSSEKLEVTYSVIVRQYALTGDAYQFYLNIKKNTEQLGSIFDAQPSQLQGNIHNVADAGEPVIGYISITNIQSKRIFLTSAIVPVNTTTNYPYDCEQDTALYRNKQGYNDVQNILINQPVTDLPTRALFTPTGSIYGFLYSTPDCTDCTLRGTTKTPSFWR
ncbi:DUF4249 domain-containing protein [Mucilaginibacter sp.]|uniref:DUF4249 domain-containing protein n=1 Tax=Mucilaginibacter sp. TaxID=1882438 RepID=UPI00284635B3|nr:DUF4249 domain-containing protein [Mucilaginibacter sp.]MDR3697470.1 DUF4249 domain-containing protein [Mucilaginibacter sp.]